MTVCLYTFQNDISGIFLNEEEKKNILEGNSGEAKTEWGGLLKDGLSCLSK